MSGPISWLVDFHLGQLFFLPGLNDGIDDSPCRFDLVRTSKETGIAGECVEQKPLVGLGHFLGVFLLEFEVEGGLAELHPSVGHFGLKVKLNSLRPVEPG